MYIRPFFRPSTCWATVRFPTSSRTQNASVKLPSGTLKRGDAVCEGSASPWTWAAVWVLVSVENVADTFA